MSEKITDLPIANTIDASSDVIPIVTNSLNATQQINRNTYLGLSSAPVGLTDSQTLTNKILTSPTISSPTLSGTIAGTYTIGGTPTFPSSVVTLTGSQTLTNKILTSPTINAPTITNATISADALSGFSSANNGTFYGISVSASKFSGAAISNSTIPYTALTTDSTWVYSTFSPAAAGFSGAVTVNVARYIQIGKTVIMDIDFTGTSNATTCTFTLPVSPKSAAFLHLTVTDNGTVQTSSGLLKFTASSTTAATFKTLAQGAFTNSGTKAIQGYGLVYEAA